MKSSLPPSFVLSSDLLHARNLGLPVVALESAVITHGLPHPHNLALARDVEAEVRAQGATPATIALLEGKVHVGMSEAQITALGEMEETRKISLRDFGIALSGKLSGGTTVAATLFAAEKAGIRVVATGGIGGVHRGSVFDISTDLVQLGRSPLVVVCAGAKAILDLPATREVLETQGVPVIGYGTNELPGFFTRTSGLPVDLRVDTPEAAAQIALSAWEAGLQRAVLLVVPPPVELAMPADEMETAIQRALKEAHTAGFRGAAVTPFLLQRVNELTGGESLRVNLALLKNNARVAAQVAKAMGAAKGMAVY
ncbi:MAG: pseudouridine-5'-phosphate glycosidase [Chloroflexi bacterium]|nr:pseudouridine-5'-phosphate glycosidase [Chloroflexota bacterium]